MSLGHGTKIIRDGLVFAYDMGNPKKSWKGKPATNYYPDIFTSQSMRAHTKHFWNGHNWVVDSVYSHPGIEGPKGVYLGKVAKHTSGALNNTWSGNSYGYMLRDITPQNAEQYYSQSCYVYVSEDCDITAIPSTIEGEAGGETSLSSGESSEYNMSVKGTWQRIGKRARSDGNTRYIHVYPRKTGVTDGSFSGFFMWGGVQVEDGNDASPLVPADDGVASRSNTEALLDFTGNHTITANSLTYNSDGSFGFNGSSNKLSFPQPNIPVSVNDWTIEMWVYPTSTGHLLVPSSNGIDQQIRWATDKFVVVTCSSADTNGRSFDTGTASAPINTWSLLTVSISYRTVSLYVNGILKSSTVNDVDIAPWSSTWNVGQRGNNTNYFGGKIGLFTVYNRPLTDQEVKQNYEATKGRFQ